MRTVIPLLVLVLSWELPAYAQPDAAPPTDAAGSPTQLAEPPTDVAEAPPVAPPTQLAEPRTDVAEAPPVAPPTQLPGACPAPVTRTIEDRLARSDEGDAAADLDLAACWRLLGQPYPESVALARALSRGLDEPAADAVRVRLETLGGAPVPGGDGTEPADDLASVDFAHGGEADDDSALTAYVLAGVAGAGLLAGTAFGLAALHESTRAERELAGDSLELEYGIAAGVCLGVGLAAGIAALVLWPEATTGPAPGPGDVGLGWEVRW